MSEVPPGWSAQPGEVRGELRLKRWSSVWIVVALLAMLRALGIDLVLAVLFDGAFLVEALFEMLTTPSLRRVRVVLTANQLRIGRATYDLRRLRRVELTPEGLQLTLKRPIVLAFHDSQRHADAAWLVARVRELHPSGDASDIPVALGGMTGRAVSPADPAPRRAPREPAR